MRYVLFVAMGTLLVVNPGALSAHEEHAGGARESVMENTGTQQTLTGEVVDVFCYLSHGPEGLGKNHAGCAKKCIQSGLPVALKVGDQLYLATMADHKPANETLAEFAGGNVTVQGSVMEQDGQHLIAITHIEKAD